MAILLPPSAPLRTPPSELKVREVLAAVGAIDILHSVSWQGLRRGRQADGEADFIVLAPSRGIAILEVKGGRIEIADGQWYSTDRQDMRHRIKSPFEQAKDSKYALIAYLKDMAPDLGRVPVVHGVVLPDVTFTGPLGMSAPRDIVLDRNDLAHPEKAIERLFEYWEASGPLSSQQSGRIIELLAPTVTLAPPLLKTLEAANKGIAQLTRQQIETLDGLRRHRRAAVLGGAGTGKTVLAVDKACRLAREGRRVALVCFNALLREEVKAFFPSDEVEVHTFHGFVREWMRKAKRNPPISADEQWFRQAAAAHLREVAAFVHDRYDAMLIDEAQDFAPDWLDACEATVTPDGIFYVFADVRQDIYKRSWEPRPGSISFELSTNCRNTRQIAMLVSALFNETASDRGVEGPIPFLLSAIDLRQVTAMCQRTVDELICTERLAPSQLAVLSDSREIIRQLRECVIADLPFCAAGESGIVAETIHRFKGLEREVVVVALSPNARLETARELLYVAFSRARAALWVIASELLIGQLPHRAAC